MENTPKVFVLETQKIQNGVTVYTEFFMDFSFFLRRVIQISKELNTHSVQRQHFESFCVSNVNTLYQQLSGGCNSQAGSFDCICMYMSPPKKKLVFII